MEKTRLEAFSDGVFAIIVTIMVLELKVPHGAQPEDLWPLAPVFLSYVLSFIYVGIYWNNHHHLYQLVRKVSGGLLWANLNLLFWLSLLPFVTAWCGENHFATWPTVIYGVDLLMCALAFDLMTYILRKTHPPDSELARAVGGDFKGKFSSALYVIGIPLGFVSPYIALFFFMLVAAIWIVPDPRVEKVIRN